MVGELGNVMSHFTAFRKDLILLDDVSAPPILEAEISEHMLCWENSPLYRPGSDTSPLKWEFIGGGVGA